jgi:hypothetical protein
MWLLSRVGQVTITVLLFLCILSAGASLRQPYKAEHGGSNQAYNKVEQRDIVFNTCGIERPTSEVIKKYKEGDTRWLQDLFDRFQDLRRSKDLDDDELTFAAWMAKILAPNHPPSSMICDGLNSCSVSVP